MILKGIKINCLALCFGGIVSASTVNYLADAGSAVQANNIQPTANGNSMVGEITVSINGGTPVLWENLGGCNVSILCGEATGSIGNGTWTLLEAGDTGAVGNPNSPETTANNAWTLTNTAHGTGGVITSVVINGDLTIGTPGVTQNSCFGATLPINCMTGIVFDRDRATATGADSGGQFGTPNGLGGITYTEQTSSEVGGAYTVGVTYSNIVTLPGADQGCAGTTFSGNSTVTGCGDEFATLSFSFTGGNAFEASGSTPSQWAFFQDTDTANAPEPLTVGLVGAGLLALAALRKLRVSRPAR
jgi:hypothetical protein